MQDLDKCLLTEDTATRYKARGFKEHKMRQNVEVLRKQRVRGFCLREC